ncbi:MAG: GNAT family N-acetyltransferase [Pseudomonadota bacterium]
MIVREMGKEDVPQVIALARQLAQHVKDPDPNLTPETVEDLAFGPARWFEALVVEDAEKVIGFAAFTQSFELHTDSRMLMITDLAVAEKSQRQGVGQLLLDALRCVARERGCSALKLEVWNENQQARAFYAKQQAQALDDVTLLQIPV